MGRRIVRKSYISLYLAIENQNTLSLGWEANVNFRFFVFDQIRNKYLCIQGIGEGVCLSMINQPQINYFTWRVDKFGSLEGSYFSDVFLVRGRKWKLLLFPRGLLDTVTSDYGFLSLYLKPDNSEIVTPNRKLYAKYKLRIRDQVNSNHLEETCENWFISTVGFGSRTFSSLKYLKDPSNGYLVDDALFVECKIDVISVVKDFSL
ncbi:hypothetical protein CIPAW_02G017500 [Carya illinoinensis]|uniref:MATH domain-containing protein n=1 Tax=Carya illinoinensis TaxID=32201 RepID=A0A8T1RAC5_CARIL|nr:hypothetical protein CIPAW_02G017500 [Carya illinoinensis]